MSDEDRSLVDAIVGMREQEAVELASARLEAGCEPIQILDLCKEAMDVVGRNFEEGEFFIPELVMAGEILSQISEVVKPHLKADAEAPGERLGTVVLGTVQGDIHDIGKNIVAFMLDVNDFEVCDLGVDVAPERFIEAIEQQSPDIVALSGFLTLSFGSMKSTIEAIEKAGLRDAVKIMIGGGQVDEAILEYTGADSFGANAMSAVNLCRQWKAEA
ncbi:MAG: methionine synthase [Deltaproteobacteria bacterium]|nr:methionine synthase [Deltaproteobacteria bacterium]